MLLWLPLEHGVCFPPTLKHPNFTSGVNYTIFTQSIHSASSSHLCISQETTQISKAVLSAWCDSFQWDTGVSIPLPFRKFPATELHQKIRSLTRSDSEISSWETPEMARQTDFFFFLFHCQYKIFRVQRYFPFLQEAIRVQNKTLAVQLGIAPFPFPFSHGTLRFEGPGEQQKTLPGSDLCAYTDKGETLILARFYFQASILLIQMGI